MLKGREMSNESHNYDRRLSASKSELDGLENQFKHCRQTGEGERTRLWAYVQALRGEILGKQTFWIVIPLILAIIGACFVYVQTSGNQFQQRMETMNAYYMEHDKLLASRLSETDLRINEKVSFLERRTSVQETQLVNLVALMREQHAMYKTMSEELRGLTAELSILRGVWEKELDSRSKFGIDQ